MEEGRGEACWENNNTNKPELSTYNKLLTIRVLHHERQDTCWTIFEIKDRDLLMWTGRRLAWDPPSCTAPKLQSCQGSDCLVEHSPDNAPHTSSVSCSHWWQTVGQRPQPKKGTIKSQELLKIYNHSYIEKLPLNYSSKLCRNQCRFEHPYWGVYKSAQIHKHSSHQRWKWWIKKLWWNLHMAILWQVWPYASLMNEGLCDGAMVIQSLLVVQDGTDSHWYCLYLLLINPLRNTVQNLGLNIVSY